MKKNLLSFALLFTVIAFAQIPTNDLIARYDFTNGSLLNTSSGNTTGYSHDLTGSSTFGTSNKTSDRFSIADNALNLFGPYLYSPDVHFSGTNSADFDITYSFWVKTSTNNTDVLTIIDDSTRGTGNLSGFNGTDFGYFIYLQEGFIRFTSRFYSLSTGGSNIQAQGFSHASTTNIADGNWHHVVVYFGSVRPNSNITLTANIYIDGVLESNSTNFNSRNFTSSPNRSGQFTIANRANNPFPALTFGYRDDIDDILVYDRELSTAEINAIYVFGSSTAGIKDNQKIEVNLFPNPTQGKITVSTTLEIKSASIYNLIGKKIKTFKTKSIDISSLPKGIYVLKLETENGKTGIQKIIKE